MLLEKFREAAASVLPIVLLVALLCLVWVPMQNDLMLAFVLGSLFLVVGMGLFSLGAELSMSQIGSHIGAKLTKSRKPWLILSVSFVLGVVITVAEPDLQVLAGNVPAINTTVLIVVVSVGVGLFLLLSMFRILHAIELRWLILGFYGLVFLLAVFADPDFLAVAFDSGGVTTGPMTVPFIMALGVGVASIRSDERAQQDSFGLVGLCSIGPILAVLILGFIYRSAPETAASTVIASYVDTVALGRGYLAALPESLHEVFNALLPIVAFFLIFQVISLRLRRAPFLRIVVGLLMTLAGLVLFLTGVNVGFSSLGYMLGQRLAEPQWRFLLVPLSMVMGWFIINAEPAVQVLNKRHLRPGHGPEPVHCRVRRHGPEHGAGADGHLHPLVCGARLRHRPGTVLRGARHLHRHRLRLRRRGQRPPDRGLHAALRHGRGDFHGRQHHDRRLRPGGPGCHDAADHRADHGPHRGHHRPGQSAQARRSPLCRQRHHRTVGGVTDGTELCHIDH